jgi:hypothetical protein
MRKSSLTTVVWRYVLFSTGSPQCDTIDSALLPVSIYFLTFVDVTDFELHLLAACKESWSFWCASDAKSLWWHYQWPMCWFNWGTGPDTQVGMFLSVQHFLGYLVQHQLTGVGFQLQHWWRQHLPGRSCSWLCPRYRWQGQCHDLCFITA